MKSATAVFAPAAVLGIMVAACGSAFAPADPPDGGGGGTEPGPAVEGGSDVVTTPPDASGAPGDGSASIDANVDAAPMCTAPKLPNAAACNAAADCCSNACKQNHVCADRCSAIQQGCALNVPDCCVGTYCSPNAFGKCAACRPNGTSPEVVGNIALAGSCCSAHVDGMGNCGP